MNKQCEICKYIYIDCWTTKNSTWIDLIDKKYNNICLNCFTEEINKNSKTKNEFWFLKLAKYKKER